MLSNKIKEFRINLSLSQRDLAELMGLSQGQIWRIESGDSIPNAKQILQLCKIFKCTPNELYGIKGIYEVATLNWD